MTNANKFSPLDHLQDLINNLSNSVDCLLAIGQASDSVQTMETTQRLLSAVNAALAITKDLAGDIGDEERQAILDGRQAEREQAWATADAGR